MASRRRRLLGRRPRPAGESVLPTSPTPQAMAEATGLIAARAYRAAHLSLSGDVPAGDVICALLGVAVALLREQFPDDGGTSFLEALGADAAGPRKF